MPDIVDWLRELAGEYAAHDDAAGAERLEEAAALIERLRYTLASWGAAAAVTRGSMAEPPVDDEPLTITDAEPNTPR